MAPNKVGCATTSAKAELARRVLETLAQGHPVSTHDALQLRNWAVRPEDSVLTLEEIEYGVTEPELKTRLLWQLTLVRFIDVRFRPGIQIGDDDIRNYFNEH